MAILDTFYILLKGDNTDVVKKTKEADKALSDFGENQKKVTEGTKQLGLSFVDLAAAGIAAFGTVFSAGKIKDAIFNTAALNAEIQRTSALSGVSAEKIAGWDYALQTVGGTSGEFQSNLLSLTDYYAQFNQQVNPEVLASLADEFKRMADNGQHAINLFRAKQLGIDDNFVLLLEKGSSHIKEIVAQYQKLSGVTPEAVEGARQFETELVTIDAKMHGFWTRVQGDVSPVLKLFENLVDALSFMLTGIENVGRSWKSFFHGLTSGDWTSYDQAMQSFFSQPSSATPQNIANDKALGLISQYESGNRNVPNASGPGGTPASTASGYYQITNGTWRQFAPKAGVDLSQYPTALSAPYDVQTKVASAIYSQQGLAPWSSDTRLMIAAAQSGVSAADNSSLNTPRSSTGQGTTVNIQNLEVNTQATDANGIATAINSSLQDKLRLTQGNFDDGIAY